MEGKSRLPKTLSIDLQLEFDRLKRVLPLGEEVQIRSVPDGNNKLDAEVKGNTIYIYTSDRDKVIDVLRHEYIEFAIGRAYQPVLDALNLFIKMQQETVYRRREKLVKGLCKLIGRELERAEG
jgi:hypothetical protein